MPLEALQLSWLLYEPNWKAFAGLTLVMAVLLVQGMCLFRSTSQALLKMEAQVRRLQESIETLPHNKEAAGPALLDKDLDEGPWMTKMEGIQGHIETVSQQVQALQAEIKMEKALEELRTLHESVETNRGLLKEMESQTSDDSVKMQQLQVNVTESTERLKQFHEAFTKSHLVSTMKMLATKAESEDLEKLSKLVQSELLEDDAAVCCFGDDHGQHPQAGKGVIKCDSTRPQEPHGESSGSGKWDGEEPQLAQDPVQ